MSLTAGFDDVDPQAGPAKRLAGMSKSGELSGEVPRALGSVTQQFAHHYGGAFVLCFVSTTRDACQPVLTRTSDPGHDRPE